jgi:hypothetical protein
LRCDTDIPIVIPGGVIIGANVLASAKLLAGSASSLGDYRTAIHNYANQLASDGLLSKRQAHRLDRCLNPARTREQFEAWGIGEEHHGNGHDKDHDEG